MSISGLNLPLWLRWVLTLLFFVCLSAAIAIVVTEAGGGNQSDATNPEAVIQANQEARIVIGEDQAPHTARLAAGQSPRAGLTAAITADVRSLIRQHDLSGALQGVSCIRSGRPDGEPISYRCTATVANVSYPFFGVVDQRTGRMVWCKSDATNEPGVSVPLAAACLR